MRTHLKTTLYFLCTLLLIGGCARALQKEYAVVDGKSVTIREIEYNRLGDQQLSGLSVEKTEPNGVVIKVAVESQKSEGKLQIEGVIAAIGETLAASQGVTLTTEDVAAIRQILETH